MTLFRNVVFIAAASGLFAGLLLAVLQETATTPLIIQAEVYESAGGETAAGEAHAHGDGSAHDHAATAPAQSEAAEAHDHGDGWAPQDGLERTFYSGAAAIVTAIGFGLVLVAISEFSGGIGNWRNGVFWGLGGFAAVILAPNLGLPPELPGMPAAELEGRQIWWYATAASTGVAIWLIAFVRSPIAVAAALVLIAVPHVIGAPQPDSHDTAVPAALHARFIAMVTVTNLVFWVALGAFAGYFRGRFMGDDGQPA